MTCGQNFLHGLAPVAESPSSAYAFPVGKTSSHPSVWVAVGAHRVLYKHLSPYPRLYKWLYMLSVGTAGGFRDFTVESKLVSTSMSLLNDLDKYNRSCPTKMVHLGFFSNHIFPT